MTASLRTWAARLGLLALPAVFWLLFGWIGAAFMAGFIVGAVSMLVLVAMHPEYAAEAFAESMGEWH